jgi:hypothetical protein
MATGFGVNQMKIVYDRAWYPARRGLQSAHMSISFVLGVDGGKLINVGPPSGYQLYCSTTSTSGKKAMYQISLPGKTPMCTDDPLVLTLSELMMAGPYAFIIGIDIPVDAPTEHMFSVVVRNNRNVVIDAAYNLFGLQLTHIYARDPKLAWEGTPVAGGQIVVHIGITFDKDTNSNTDLPAVAAMLINFPQGYEHDVKRATDVKNLNKFFPVAPAKTEEAINTPFCPLPEKHFVPLFYGVSEIFLRLP